LQTSIEIPARSLETLAEALAHTIGMGLLKQPDKQKSPRLKSESELLTGAANAIVKT
jgi:hypothetical protein